MAEVNTPTYTKKDFESDQAVRWCPGCGDYAILAQTQKTMPTFGRKKEDFVFVSGIERLQLLQVLRSLIQICLFGSLQEMEMDYPLEETILCMHCVEIWI